MSLIKNIVEFFKKIFNKESNKKMLNKPMENLQKREKTSFSNSLKVDIVETKKKEVETPICYGDGLRIQTKINY